MFVISPSIQENGTGLQVDSYFESRYFRNTGHLIDQISGNQPEAILCFRCQLSFVEAALDALKKNGFQHIPLLWHSTTLPSFNEQPYLNLIKHGVIPISADLSQNPMAFVALLKGLIQYSRSIRYSTKNHNFNISHQSKSLKDSFLERVQDYLENNIFEVDFSIEKLGRDLGMSRTNFFEKTKNLTGLSPSRMVMKFRLDRAAMLLELNGGNISEIAYDVGFSSTAYFSKCFKEHFGLRPSEYVSRHEMITRESVLNSHHVRPEMYR